MTPEELTGRISNQKIRCKHDHFAVCKKCKEKNGDKPYTVFLLCKSDNCTHTDEECGYFWGSGDEKLCGQPIRQRTQPTKMTTTYTADSVKISLAPKYEGYYAKLAIGQSPTWKCDQRTIDLFCLSLWVSDELTILNCPDEDRRFVLNFYNRKARAENDLFSLAATAINSFLQGKIERYRGR